MFINFQPFPIMSREKCSQPRKFFFLPSKSDPSNRLRVMQNETTPNRCQTIKFKIAPGHKIRIFLEVYIVYPVRKSLPILQQILFIQDALKIFCYYCFYLVMSQNILVGQGGCVGNLILYTNMCLFSFKIRLSFKHTALHINT